MMRYLPWAPLTVRVGVTILYVIGSFFAVALTGMLFGRLSLPAVATIVFLAIASVWVPVPFTIKRGWPLGARMFLVAVAALVACLVVLHPAWYVLTVVILAYAILGGRP